MSSSREILSRFIVLEGLDGAGTTTQCRLFSERCTREGIRYHATSEPTDGEAGKLCRFYLRGRGSVDPRTMAFLFAADRNEHLEAAEHGIRARVSAGELVVCDRYLFSSLAYQSVGCGFDFVFGLNEHFPLPQILVFLDVNVEEGARRLASRTEKEIYEALAYQEAVKERYERALSVFESSPMKVLRVDAQLSEAEISRRIWNFAAAHHAFAPAPGNR